MMATSLALFLLPVLFHSNKACPSIRFVKNESLTGMTSDAGLIAIETSQLRAECPVKCVRKTGCKSVFYDQTSGICRLHSKYFQQSESGLITNAGFSYYERMYIIFVFMFCITSPSVIFHLNHLNIIESGHAIDTCKRRLYWVV